jgi:inorganic pyrophosphatase
MTKAEIIANTLGLMNLNDEPDYQTIVIAELQRKLPEGVEIKTCEDFPHLNVKCCDTCHNSYPHYEMKLIQLPDGCPARVCDTVRWAIHPEEYRKPQEWSRNTPEGKLLSKIFGEDVEE